MQHKVLTVDGKLALGGGDSADRMAILHGIQLVADSDTANVIGYKDGAATAGKEFVELTAATNTERERDFRTGLQSAEGFYFVLTGTNVQLHVLYE